MRLKQPFLKLPIRFDTEALAAEIRALPASAWTAHPTGFVGNEAVRLVTPFGEATDAIEGPMAPTENLQRCAYVREIMAEIGGVWGRSRLMGLAAGSEVPSHIDTHYYWRTHLRIHIPVITNPGVLFTCGGETVHMAAGECWVFDSYLRHDVQNKGTEQRIHLVLDTVGGGILPQLMKDAQSGSAEPRLLCPGERRGDDLQFEVSNSPRVMSPWEMRCHLAFIKEQAGSDPKILDVLEGVEQFIDAWAASWARFETSEEGRPTYARLLDDARTRAIMLGSKKLSLANGLELDGVIEDLIFQHALAAPSARLGDQATRSSTPQAAAAKASYRERFEKPIFIVSTPRSGSTLLFETLEQAPGLYSTKQESHLLIEEVPGLSPGERGWSSNRLTGADAKPDRAELLSKSFYTQLTDRDGNAASGRVRLLEKTPKNALRVPFFDAIWPDSSFVYLYRDVRETLYSMMEAWSSGAFRTYPQLPGWKGLSWSLLLVPGWQRLNGRQLPQIVANQWVITTETLLDDLEKLDPARVHAVEFGAFLKSPQAEIERLAGALGLGWDRSLGTNLPPAKTTLSPPRRDKWRNMEEVIESVWPIVDR